MKQIRLIVRSLHEAFPKLCAAVAVVWSCFGICQAQKTISDWRTGLQRAPSSKDKADICFNISRKYADALKIDSALFYSEKIREFSEKDNYETGLGKYHLAKSIALYYRGQHSDSKKNAREAITIFSAQKDHLFLGIAYWQVGTAEAVAGFNEAARQNYWSSAHHLIQTKEKENLFRTYFWLGRNYDNNSDYDSSASYFIKALRLAEDMKDPFMMSSASVELGEAFLSMRDLTRANQYLGYGLRTRTSTANKVGVWSELGHYAVCLSLLHEFETADSVISEFEKLARQFNHAWGWIMLDKLKGILAYEMQDYGKAMTHLHTAYSKIDQITENKTDIKDIALNLGKTEFRAGRYESAIVHLREAAQMAVSIRTFVDAIEADFLLTECFQKMNRPDSALHYFRNYSSLKESVLSFEKQKMITEVTSRYQTEKNEQEIRILQKETEANSYLLQLQKQQIDQQRLEHDKKSQQLELVSRQNEINRLEAEQKNLALESKQKEITKKQSDLVSVSKESRLRMDIAIKEKQRKELAYAAIIAILVLGSIAFFKYRQSSRLSRQLAASLISLEKAQEQLIKSEKEKEAENVRVRISQDIHDEVGATLSGVALFSEIAREKMRQHRDDAAMEYLEHIAVNSKEMVDKMSDIVWAIDPVNDSFGSMMEKLQGYTANLCAGKNINLHAGVDDSVRGYQPSMDVKRNLYLLIKEAVNNAVKYSEAKNIWLTVAREGNMIIAGVKDDGQGFQPEMVVKGNGLNNMQARANHLEGELTVESGKDTGTSVRLQFNFHPTGGAVQVI